VDNFLQSCMKKQFCSSFYILIHWVRHIPLVLPLGMIIAFSTTVCLGRENIVEKEIEECFLKMSPRF
jgi:hypothetical protein